MISKYGLSRQNIALCVSRAGLRRILRWNERSLKIGFIRIYILILLRAVLSLQLVLVRELKIHKNISKTLTSVTRKITKTNLTHHFIFNRSLEKSVLCKLILLISRSLCFFCLCHLYRIFFHLKKVAYDWILLLIILQIFSLARDWSKRVTWMNIPQIKLGNIYILLHVLLCSIAEYLTRPSGSSNCKQRVKILSDTTQQNVL